LGDLRIGGCEDVRIGGFGGFGGLGWDGKKE